jgi:bacteriorhodopsin
MAPSFESILSKRDYDVLQVNPPPASYNYSDAASKLDWAIFALHAFLLLCVVGWAFVTQTRRRLFHLFAIAILFIASIYYFCLASDLGSVAIRIHHNYNTFGDTRQVFYARWIGYFLNFSTIVFALCLLSGVGWATIIFTTFLTMSWATLMLLGTLTPTKYKWGFFVFAVFTYVLIGWNLLGVARAHVGTLDATPRGVFTMLAAYEAFLLFLYHICAGISEYGNVISPTGEHIFYCILDVLSQGVFALLLILRTKGIDYDYLNLGWAGEGRVRGHNHVKRSSADPATHA